MKLKFIYILIFTISLIMLPNEAYAQTMRGDNEISLGVGTLTVDQILGALLTDGGRTILSLGAENTENLRFLGAYSFSYKYYVKNKFAAGLTIVSDWVAGDLVDDDDEPIGSLKRHYLTIAPEIKLVYVNDMSFRLYGVAGIGYTFGTERAEDTQGVEDEPFHINHLNFHITPIGIRFGRTVGVFAEIGFGYKGVIAAGVSGYF